MSQRGRHARAVSLLRCALAMVTVAVAVLCVSGASRSPATGDGTAVTGYSSSVVVPSADVPSAAGPAADEPASTAPRPCEKKGLSEPSSTRGDLRVPEPSPAGSVDTGTQRGTPLSSTPLHPAAGTSPPPSCASSTSTTVLRI
ncbi:hypothetical protein [Streptomyces sp. WG7]|uniref:hypothetical protein n=1 Tax=Streptomyces sp. WG7 TaxID=3417650 RepID=UPI003CEC7D40